jgi:restriction endonuclease S subunit
MAQKEASELPKGWDLGAISCIVAEANTGLVRSSKEQHLQGQGQYPYIKMNNLTSSGKFDFKKMVYVDAIEKEIVKGQLYAGDFVFNTRNSLELVGKCGVFDRDSNLPILFNNNLLRMRFHEVLPEIVAYWLNSPIGKQQLSNITSATTNVAAIYQKSLLKLEVPLPPIAEQKRIVEKLDSLLAQVETIGQRLNNLPNIIKRFRQSVLAAAVSGKLTEQWRKENCIAVPKPITLGQIVELAYGKSLPAKTRSGEGHPVFGSNGIVGYHEEQIVNGPFIIVGRKGSFGVVTWSEKSGWPIDTTYFVKLKDGSISLKFCFYLLQTLGLTTLNRSTAIPGLNREDAYESNCLLPTIEDQTEIVRLVEQHFALADSLEKHLKTAKQRVDNLTQSILAKAFKGELVPQDPNDEPAEQLLSRIKTARAEAELLEKAAKKVTSKTKRQKGVVS